MTEQRLVNIETPHDHDVLSKCNYSVNYHSGNGYFCRLLKKHKLEYFKATKSEKKNIPRAIVNNIRSRDPPGRFLKLDETTKKWHDIGDKKALSKTRQALRERAYEFEKLKGKLNESTSESSLEEPLNLIASVSRKIQMVSIVEVEKCDFHVVLLKILT